MKTHIVSSAFSLAVLLQLCKDSSAQELCAGTSGLHTCGEIDTCQNGTIVTGLCSGGDDNVCCLNGDVSQCTAESGTCLKDTHCDPAFGEQRSGLCPGDSSVKCCVPLSTGQTCPGESSWNLCMPNASCTTGIPIDGICSVGDVCCLQGDPSSCAAAGGVCDFQDNCELEFSEIQSGLCPGSSNIKCCIPKAPVTNEVCAGQDPGTTGCVDPATCTTGVVVESLCSSQTANECCLQGTDSGCVAVGGTCKTVTDCSTSGGTTRTGLCPGASDIRCCVPSEEPDHPGPYRDKCFPLEAGSLSFISVNWGSRRAGGARCHCGIDIFTQAPGLVKAVTSGVVTNIFGFLSCKDGWSMPPGTQGIGPKQPTKAILVYDSVEDITYNYGEVDYDQIYVSIGDVVNKGDILGRAGYCGMLHFEMYSGQRTTNQRWYPPEGQVSAPPDKCATDFLATKPAALQDPRPLISSLGGLYCGANARAVDETGAYIFSPTGSPITASPSTATPTGSGATASPSTATPTGSGATASPTDSSGATATPTSPPTNDETMAIVIVSVAAVGLSGVAAFAGIMVARRRRQGPDVERRATKPRVYIKPPEL